MGVKSYCYSGAIWVVSCDFYCALSPLVMVRATPFCRPVFEGT